MSDSINEQRCERNGLPISGCVASEHDCAKFGVCAAGPSVVTPPAKCEWCDQGIEFAGSEAMNRCRAGCAVTHPDFAHYSDTELGIDTELGMVDHD